MRSIHLHKPDQHPLFHTERRFLSIALDWALILGERWWDGTRRTRRGFGSVRAPELALGEKRLIDAAAALGPAYLRLGGSETDRISFGPSDAPCPTRLSPERWDEAADFAKAAGLDLFVSIGAGVCARDREGRWLPDSFRLLLRHLREKGQEVAVWELGNEVNGFPFIHGLSAWVSPRQYAEDFRLFRKLAKENGGVVAGPAAAVWPLIGEPLPIVGGVARRLGEDLDMLTWHYYPYQGRRGVFGVRRVGFRNALRSRARRSASRLAGRMRRLGRSAGSVWLSETGSALFGGEAGVSDRFVGSLWWLDHLGGMAAAGMGGVVRQALVGGEYGLLEQEGLRPRPDFWCSLLWKKVMGTAVYAPERAGPFLTVYRHSRADGKQGWSALVVNGSRRRGATLHLPTAGEGWSLAGPLDSPGVEVNGHFLGPETYPDLPSLPPGRRISGRLQLGAGEALFVLFDQ